MNPVSRLFIVLVSLVATLSANPAFAATGTVGGGGSGGTLCLPQGEGVPTSKMFYDDLQYPIVVDFIKLAIPEYASLNAMMISKEYLKRFGYSEDIVFHGTQVTHNYDSNAITNENDFLKVMATKDVLLKKTDGSAELVHVVISTVTWRPSPESEEIGKFELTIDRDNGLPKIQVSGGLNCLGY